MDSDLSDADSVGDLSFEAESPLAPPAELLERLPSCDWLLQGDRRQIFFPPLEAPGRPQEQRCWSPFLEHGSLRGWATKRDLPQALGHRGPGSPNVSGRYQEVPGPSLITGQGMPQVPRAWALQVQRLPRRQHDAARAQGGGTRPVPPARGRRNCCTSSSWSSSGKTAYLSLCLSTSWTALGSSLLKPKGRPSLRMKTRWCIPSSTSPCGRSLWPPSGPSPSTTQRWPPAHVSCSSARPSSWSPSRRFATRTEERLLSTTSTALTTECTWWTTPRGTAVAAPSSDTAQPRPDPTAHICRGGQTRSLSSLTVGCSGQPHTNPAVSFQRIQLLCQAPSHSEALLVESILCLTYKNSSTHVPLGEIT
ncbi:protein SSUH2 homolog isoform X10 [Camelus ferus]|uniref:Protein SSUH2 homolog isoform X10 n=2 Tax=Camelus TaxID=9836 RepID=A0A8B8RBX6_CAMFR|nr:protein SSUH2 homolog isoform X10 [Camelus ferus]